MKDLLQRQKQIMETIAKQYQKSHYNEATPLVILNPFGTCPLAALMKFSTHQSCTVSFCVEDDIEFKNNLSETEHELAIIGLKPGCTNRVTLTCCYEDGTVATYEHKIETNPLPEEYPTIELVTCDESQMAQGMMALSLGKSDGVKTVSHLYSMIDQRAQVRWLYTGVACHIFMKLQNGNLIVDAPVSSGICGAYTAAGFIEMDFLGRILEFYPIPNGLHHDVIELPNGNFLAITQREQTKQDLLVEIDRQTKEVVDEWDFRQILDFNRQTVIDKISVNHPLDWLHLNSLVYDEKSDCIIASSRNQSTVVKFNKQTLEIKWILAPHEGWCERLKPYLLEPIGDCFEWSYAQHTPVLTTDGNLLIFDNGNFRSYDLEKAILAYQNYSRAVEYRIDEENMTVEQIWQYGKERGSELYCAYLGAVRLLENQNKLICFGGITKDIFGNPIDDMKSNRMKNRVTVIEMSDEEIIFEITMKDTDITKASGYKCYRAEKMTLY